MKKITLLSVIICVCTYVCGQVETSGIEPNTKVTTDYDVDLHTGVLDVSVPLASVATPNISIPIVANYKARGIKVDQVASEIGLGWHFYGGPMITREVRGLPDCNIGVGGLELFSQRGREYLNLKDEVLFYGLGNLYPDYKGDFSNQEEVYSSVKSAYEQINDKSIKKYYDTEPDIFTLNLPTGSVKFLYDAVEKKCKTIGLSNVKIDFRVGSLEFNPYNNIKGLTINPQDFISFDVRDDQGNFYVFSAPELTVIDDVSQSSFSRLMYNSTWRIISITDASNRTINFSYEDNTVTYQSSKNVKSTDLSNALVWISSKVSNIYVRQKLLKSVISPLEIVHVVYDDNRPDLVSGRLIKKISVSDKISNKVKKNIVLKYDFYKNTTVKEINPYHDESKTPIKIALLNELLVGDEQVLYNEIVNSENWHVFLKSVQEYDNQGEKALLPYKFSYNSTPLPSRRAVHQDHWGYFKNLGTNVSEVTFPIVKNYTSLTNRHSRSVYPLVADTEFTEFDWVGVSGGQSYGTIPAIDRTVSTADCQAGVLNKIQYPLGGSVEFVYESNKVKDAQFAGGYLNVGGLRVREIVTRPENKTNNTPIVTQYLYEGGKLFQLPHYTESRYVDPSNETRLNYVPEFFTVYSKSLVRLENMFGNAIGYDKVTVKTPGQGRAEYGYYSALNYLENSTPVENHKGPNFIELSPTLGGSFSPDPIPFSYFTPTVIVDHNGNENLIPYSVLKNVKLFDEEGNEVSESAHEYKTVANRNENGKLEREKGLKIKGQYQYYAWSNYYNFLNTSILPVKTIIKQYAQDDYSKFLTSTKETNYELVNGAIFIRSTQSKAPDNSEVRSTYTYSFDLVNETNVGNVGSLSGESMLGLKRAYNERLWQLPVEYITEIKKPSWSSFKLVSAGLNTYEPGEFGTVHMTKQYSLELDEAIPLSNFQNVSKINYPDGSAELQKDNRYALENKFQEYDKFDNLIQSTGRSGVPSGTVWGYEQMLPIASCAGCNVVANSSTNIVGNEFDYEGFESNQSTHWYYGKTGSNWDYSQNYVTHYSAYTGNRSYLVTKDAELNQDKNFQKQFYPIGDNEVYIFSAWVKTLTGFDNRNNEAKLIVFPADKTDYNVNRGIQLTEALPSNNTYETIIPQTNVKWQYVEVEVNWKDIKDNAQINNPNNLVLNCMVTPNTNSDFYIDDVMFRPKNAITSYKSYDLRYGVTSSTDANRKTSRVEYDAFSRVLKIRNFKGDITKRYNYEYGEETKYEVSIKDRWIIENGVRIELWLEANFLLRNDVINSGETIADWTVSGNGNTITKRSGAYQNVIFTIDELRDLLSSEEDEHDLRITFSVRNNGTEFINTDYIAFVEKQFVVERPVLEPSLNWQWQNENNITLSLENVAVDSINWIVNETVIGKTNSPQLVWGIPTSTDRRDSVSVKVEIFKNDEVDTLEFKEAVFGIGEVTAEMELLENDLVSIDLELLTDVNFPLFTKYKWEIDSISIPQEGKAINVRLQKGQTYRIRSITEDEQGNLLTTPVNFLLITPFN